jgi:oxygen-dependent protoporphyrinogen oxidase
VVIVGGGITGLAAARRLIRLAPAQSLQVTVLEADARFGGKIRTESFAGRTLDVGAEALLTRVPQAVALCRELGLGDDLVAPATDQPFIWTRGELRPLPPRMMSGLPDGVGAVAASGILSRAGMLRAGLDLWLPARAPTDDVSIGRLVRRRLGREVFERLIDPLLGGIHGGSADELSVRATAPQLEAALRSRRGLVRGLRALAGGAHAAPAGPMFLSLRGGLGALTDALVAGLSAAELRNGVAVQAIEESSEGRVRVVSEGSEELLADHVVLATPAFAAAEILQHACPEASSALRRIEYASVASVLLAYPAAALPAPLGGSGFLVPRTEGRTITACTWASAKWPQLAGEQVLLRASVGRFRDARALGLDDDRLVERVHAELVAAMGLREAPKQASVARFDRGLAQYRVGHLDLVAGIDAALARLPAVTVTGASYRGVGVGACVRDGEAAASRIATALAGSSLQLTPVAP